MAYTYREDCAAFAAKMVELCPLLPGTWTVDATDADGEPSWRAIFARADGLAISAGLRSSDGKVRFSPMVPLSPRSGMQSLRDVLPYDQRDKASIEASVSLTRPLSAIAKDVTRRVIEPYAAVFHYVGERERKERDGIAEMTRMIAEVEKRFPGAQAMQNSRPSDPSVSVYMGATNHAYRATIHQGGSVTVEVRSIPFDVAMKVLDAMVREAE